MYFSMYALYCFRVSVLNDAITISVASAERLKFPKDFMRADTPSNVACLVQWVWMIPVVMFEELRA